MKDIINKATQGPDHPSKSPTDSRGKTHSIAHALHRTPNTTLNHQMCSSQRYLHLVLCRICEPRRTQQSRSRVAILSKPWVWNKAENNFAAALALAYVF